MFDAQRCKCGRTPAVSLIRSSWWVRCPGEDCARTTGAAEKAVALSMWNKSFAGCVCGQAEPCCGPGCEYGE